MKLSRQSRLQLSIQKTIFLLLFISIIGMLAWVSNHYNHQFDLTANNRHSLSESSVSLLNTLDRPVTVHAYTTDDVTRQGIKEIIERYQRLKSNFYLHIFNPDIDIEQVKRDGIVMNKPFAFVVFYKQHMEHINSLSEQAISNALLRLNRRDKQQVIFLSGHGERELDGTDSRAYSILNQQLSALGFKLRTLNLLENELPDNTKLVVIAAPAFEYLAGEIKQLEQYLAGGGNFLWLVDPGALFGLEKIASSLGLQFQDGLIIDNNPTLRNTLNIQHPGIIPVTEYFSHLITSSIRFNTLFPMARGISPLTNEVTINDWQAEALFNSGVKSWTESAGLQDEMVFSTSDGDVAGPITMAVALHRKNPVVNDTATKKSQRIVIIGDSDFLSDTHIGSGANLSLGLNIFNWLVGDDDFIAVEMKPAADTKLTLTDTQLVIIGFGFLIIIPLLLLIIGFRIWYVRKNR